MSHEDTAVPQAWGDTSTRFGKRRRVWSPVTPSLSPSPDLVDSMDHHHEQYTTLASSRFNGHEMDTGMDCGLDSGESDTSHLERTNVDGDSTTCQVVAKNNHDMQDLTQRFLRELQSLDWQGTSQGSLHAVGNVSISQLDFSCIKSFMDPDGVLRFKVTNGGGDCMQIVGRRLLLPGQTLSSHDHDSIFMGLSVTFSYGCPKRITYPSEAPTDTFGAMACTVASSRQLALPGPAMNTFGVLGARQPAQDPMAPALMADVGYVQIGPSDGMHLQHRHQKRAFDSMSDDAHDASGESCPIAPNSSSWKIHASTTSADVHRDRSKRRRVHTTNSQDSLRPCWNAEPAQTTW